MCRACVRDTPSRTWAVHSSWGVKGFGLERHNPGQPGISATGGAMVVCDATPRLGAPRGTVDRRTDYRPPEQFFFVGVGIHARGAKCPRRVGR